MVTIFFWTIFLIGPWLTILVHFRFSFPFMSSTSDQVVPKSTDFQMFPLYSDANNVFCVVPAVMIESQSFTSLPVSLHAPPLFFQIFPPTTVAKTMRISFPL